jgi:hypothetical protein
VPTAVRAGRHRDNPVGDDREQQVGQRKVAEVVDPNWVSKP